VYQTLSRGFVNLLNAKKIATRQSLQGDTAIGSLDLKNITML
jgi:hypothetical protein